MQPPEIPDTEDERIAELRSLLLLDSSPEERFDRITRVAKQLFNVPIALVSLIDTERQWFKSNVGLDATETGRDISFCGHAILGEDVFIIENAAEDERFSDNPLVAEGPEIRFYAGAPLAMPSGNNLGTLCIISPEPRKFGPEQSILLHDLSKIVISELVSQQAATQDALTGIHNRRGFEILAQKSMANSARYGWKSALVFLDLNKFKEINDTYGHQVGDQALVDFSRLLTQMVRESDIIARLGGDEFVVMLMNSEEAEAREKVKVFMQELKQYNQQHNQPYELCASYGIVEYVPEDHASLEELISAADELMYHNKQKKD
ncbi:Diguanylate cyclase with GAF sensor [Oleispira antarctica RB-8]|uniref:Diguanylate cyclase with GAF sensor n=1 Tax=Oleispira antarctica RB-8 TaxID=698738 RepID=R4YL96_OLEAN|nr:Diguanylate cyclase with GAF sensor [Oleispira antarctica RB-8]